ncbi:MAG: hypothetical protein CMO55_07070 [Verrucomicrobiales bacterium]|nr:hypothetical protein [Verrucomicrobiales bacterium]
MEGIRKNFLRPTSLFMAFTSKKKRLKIDGDLCDELASNYEKCGYSSVDEMAEHLIRTGLDQIQSALGDSSVSEEERKLAEEQLRGLGYLK